MTRQHIIAAIDWLAGRGPAIDAALHRLIAGLIGLLLIAQILIAIQA
jgi:hypothetical protein